MTNPVRVIMSPPDYFDIEYSINPWMNVDNKVHAEHAAREWESLKSNYLALGAIVETIPPVQGLPDLVFTTDHGVWIDDTFYLSNFRYPQRQKEQNVAIPWYQDQNIKVQPIPETCFMEGGDVLYHAGHIYLGYGYRTSRDTATYLQDATNLPTVALKLVDEAFYHLDTCFFPLTYDTAFYYPPAFDPASVKVLKHHFDILITLTSHEAEGFACNSVVLGKTVLCQLNPTFEQKLIDLGYSPITLDMHEFNKSGGGIHCLSQILR